MSESNQLDLYCISSSDTLYRAMIKINENSSHAVFVTDTDGRLVGSVTDGDIRRALLHGEPDLQRRVESAVNRNVRYLDQGVTEQEQRYFMRRNGIEQLPLVDEQRRVVRIALAANLFAARRRNTPVLLMAGGMGQRLGSLTRERPKPLVMLDDKPIMEHILLKFRREGFRRFFISINHMGAMIQNYFGNGSRYDGTIVYLSETSALGTAGALSLIEDDDFESIVVSNCDVICNAEYGDMLDFHEAQANDMTLGVVTQKFGIPFGVVETVASKITGFKEKPDYEVSVNAGLYVLERSMLANVPRNTRFDMPELLLIALREQMRCAAFTINDDWIDVGRPADLERARTLLLGRQPGASSTSRSIDPVLPSAATVLPS